MKMTVNLVIRQHDGWYIGTAKEMPGVFSQGKSLEELRNNLLDACRLMLEDGGSPGPGDAGVPSLPSYPPPSLEAAVKLELPVTWEKGNEPS